MKGEKYAKRLDGTLINVFAAADISFSINSTYYNVKYFNRKNNLSMTSRIRNQVNKNR